MQLDKLPDDGVFKGLLLVSADEVVAVAELPVHDPELPVVFWLSVGNVQLDKLPDDGVPKAGVVRLGEVDKTTLPDPVEPVTPVPPLATDNVPVVPATIGNPVQLVNVPEPGVFKVPPLVSAAEVVAVAALPVVFWLSVGNVQLVNVPAEGVPRLGVVKAGFVAKTNAPDPVSSETAVASCAEVAVNVLLAKFIVLLVSVSVVALPTKVSVEVGSVKVPVLTIELMTGVANVGDVPKTNAPVPVSPVTAAAKLALLGVAKNVATPVPSPEMFAAG